MFKFVVKHFLLTSIFPTGDLKIKNFKRLISIMPMWELTILIRKKVQSEVYEFVVNII